MSYESEKSAFANGNHNNYVKNGGNNPKKRLFEWTENYPQQKLGEQDLNHSNHVGVIVWCLVFTIVIVKFALYIGMDNISIKEVVASVKDTAEGQFGAFYSRVTSLKLNFMNIIVCGLIGLLVTIFSWMVVYLDSDVPGVNPPTPLSPRKNRTGYHMHVQHQYSLNYLMTIINGFAVFVFLIIGS